MFVVHVEKAVTQGCADALIPLVTDVCRDIVETVRADTKTTRGNPAGDIKITKSKSSEKVDGMVALVMALGENMTTQEEDSFTLTHGIRVI